MTRNPNNLLVILLGGSLISLFTACLLGATPLSVSRVLNAILGQGTHAIRWPNPAYSGFRRRHLLSQHLPFITGWSVLVHGLCLLPRLLGLSWRHR